MEKVEFIPIPKDIPEQLTPGEFDFYQNGLVISAGGRESTAKYAFVGENCDGKEKMLVLDPLTLKTVTNQNRRVSVGTGSANHVSVPISAENSQVVGAHFGVEVAFKQGKDLLVENRSDGDTLEIYKIRNPHMENETVKPKGICSPKFLDGHEKSYVEIDVNGKEVYLSLDENRKPYIITFTDIDVGRGKMRLLKETEEKGLHKSGVGDVVIRCRELEDGRALFTLQNIGDDEVSYRQIDVREPK